MFGRRAFLEQQRDADPNGRLSDNDLDRMADFEQLEWDISDIEDLSDVKRVLYKLAELVRTTP